MAYNPWYTDTYEPILQLAAWDVLSADVEKKIVGIFSWMPQTIMAINHAGGRKKYEFHSALSIRTALDGVSENFARIKGFSLLTFDVQQYQSDVEALCNTLFPMLGSVGASKYMHFSCPLLLPMWDRQIRLDSKCKDSVGGYLKFVKIFRDELSILENQLLASQKYPGNLVRGWDIVRMELRTMRSKRAAACDHAKKLGA